MMGKSAAQVAQEISDRKSENKTKKRVEEQDEIVGGIDEKPPSNPVITILDGVKTGTPYDLVEGRPNIDYWGPLPGYQFIQTQHGEYSITEGKILRFTYKEEWDPKAGTMVTRAKPQYEKAPQELIDYVLSAEVAS
jgi:hypothetical protein